MLPVTEFSILVKFDLNVDLMVSVGPILFDVRRDFFECLFDLLSQVTAAQI
jgi:hypothetical protein